MPEKLDFSFWTTTSVQGIVASMLAALVFVTSLIPSQLKIGLFTVPNFQVQDESSVPLSAPLPLSFAVVPIPSSNLNRFMVSAGGIPSARSSSSFAESVSFPITTLDIVPANPSVDTPSSRDPIHMSAIKEIAVPLASSTAVPPSIRMRCFVFVLFLDTRT